jgi:hypothetical protein
LNRVDGIVRIVKLLVIEYVVKMAILYHLLLHAIEFVKKI